MSNIEQPKKKHTVRNVLLIMTALGVAFVVGIVALIGSAANSVSKSLDAEAKNDRPAVIKPGASFTHDGYKVAAGWQVGTDQFGMPVVRYLHVTNVGHSNEQDTPMFTFSLWTGQQSLAEIDATGHQIAKGQSTDMDTFSTDQMHGSADDRQMDHATIKVADVW